MDELAVWRAALRDALIAARLELDGGARVRCEGAIHARLRRVFADVRGMTLAYYMPFRGEPDVRALADEWRAAGACTALPVVVGRGQPLEFRAWWPGAPTRRGAFSLPVPDGTALVLPQVVLLPPVGFDALGFRLGYGGGYFDRTLATLRPAPIKIGVAFELSRIETIRPQAYDIAMDYVVTENDVLRVTPHGLVPLGDDARILPLSPAAAGDDDDARRCASPPCYAQDFPPAD